MTLRERLDDWRWCALLWAFMLWVRLEVLVDRAFRSAFCSFSAANRRPR